MRTSVLYPVMPGSGTAARPFADLVSGGLAARLWMGSSLQTETHQNFAYLAGAGYRIPVGTSVMLTPFRHPFEAAAAARSLAMLTGQPAVAGFGGSTPELVAAMLGAPYRRPASAVRDYLHQVRGFLDGTLSGLPPVQHPPVELGAGVLRPGMARAAGQAADVAITWMTPPEYLQSTLAPALREGAADDRVPPRIATVVHVALTRPGRVAARLAHAAAYAHLRMPHYVTMFQLAGLDISVDDPEAGARRLVSGGLFVTGTADEIAAKLDGYRKAGVDEIILNTAGVLLHHGADAAAEEAAAILGAMTG